MATSLEKRQARLRKAVLGELQFMLHHFNQMLKAAEKGNSPLMIAGNHSRLSSFIPHLQQTIDQLHAPLPSEEALEKLEKHLEKTLLPVKRRLEAQLKSGNGPLGSAPGTHGQADTDSSESIQMLPSATSEDDSSDGGPACPAVASNITGRAAARSVRAVGPGDRRAAGHTNSRLSSSSSSSKKATPEAATEGDAVGGPNLGGSSSSSSSSGAPVASSSSSSGKQQRKRARTTRHHQHNQRGSSSVIAEPPVALVEHLDEEAEALGCISEYFDLPGGGSGRSGSIPPAARREEREPGAARMTRRESDEVLSLGDAAGEVVVPGLDDVADLVVPNTPNAFVNAFDDRGDDDDGDDEGDDVDDADATRPTDRDAHAPSKGGAPQRRAEHTQQQLLPGDGADANKRRRKTTQRRKKGGQQQQQQQQHHVPPSSKWDHDALRAHHHAGRAAESAAVVTEASESSDGSSNVQELDFGGGSSSAAAKTGNNNGGAPRVVDDDSRRAEAVTRSASSAATLDAAPSTKPRPPSHRLLAAHHHTHHSAGGSDARRSLVVFVGRRRSRGPRAETCRSAATRPKGFCGTRRRRDARRAPRPDGGGDKALKESVPSRG